MLHERLLASGPDAALLRYASAPKCCSDYSGARRLYAYSAAPFMPRLSTSRQCFDATIAPSPRLRLRPALCASAPLLQGPCRSGQVLMILAISTADALDFLYIRPPMPGWFALPLSCRCRPRLFQRRLPRLPPPPRRPPPFIARHCR